MRKCRGPGDLVVHEKIGPISAADMADQTLTVDDQRGLSLRLHLHEAVTRSGELVIENGSRS